MTNGYKLGEVKGGNGFYSLLGIKSKLGDRKVKVKFIAGDGHRSGSRLTQVEN